MRSVLALILLSAACSRAPASPQSYAPNEVTELAALPSGYTLGEALTEGCSVAPRVAFEDEALSNVDCSYERLSRALRARAGEDGARFLVGKRCRGGPGARPRLSCTASVARPTETTPLQANSAPSRGPAPSASQVRDLDEPRPQDAARIRVTFRAGKDATALPARAYDRVAETTQGSVGRRALGQVSARCDEGACTADSLRHALRVAAGRVGAGEVSGVACFAEEDGARCVATALVPWSS
jgi:hypothetical protein